MLESASESDSDDAWGDEPKNMSEDTTIDVRMDDLDDAGSAKLIKDDPHVWQLWRKATNQTIMQS